MEYDVSHEIQKPKTYHRVNNWLHKPDIEQIPRHKHIAIDISAPEVMFITLFSAKMAYYRAIRHAESRANSANCFMQIFVDVYSAPLWCPLKYSMCVNVIVAMHTWMH